MENLFLNQQEITETISKFIVNLQKAGLERRTGDYFRKRLELLENYWIEYERNHQSICEFEVLEHPYFTSLAYERTKELYLSAKELIYRQSKESTEAPTTSAVSKKDTANDQGKVEVPKAESERPAHQVAGLPPRTLISRGSTSKFDDLLRKQYVNFTAFVRTANSINLDDINEKWEFEDVLKELQSRWSAIDSLHWEIYMESNGDEEEYEVLFTKHETRFIDLKKRINKKLWSVSHREKTVPKIDIPIFSGNYQQWTSFKDLFFEAVHNNPSLSSAQKMQFLKGKIRGEAERLIQHLHISSDNYNACWEILNNRYNNKKLILTAHLNTLLGLPNITQPTLAQIKKIHDTTLETLHAIENLGIDVSTWDPFLVHVLSQKLDSETYSDYLESLKNPRELPILKDFLSYLESKFTSLESVRRKQDQMSSKSTVSNNSKTKFHHFDTRPYNSQHNTNKAFHVTTIKCPHCGEEHSLYHCKEFHSMSSDRKLKLAKEQKLCINCLFSHNGKQCISTKRCKRCNGKHNTLIHDACIKDKSSPNNNMLSTKPTESVGNNSHVSQGGSAEILLATALIKVISEDGNCHIMRALIDQGSQISLISESAAQRLGVRRTFCRGVVYGIGEKASNSKGMISITCMSIYSDFQFSTDVLIMNNLIKNLPQVTFIKPEWPYHQNIDLADPEFYVSRPVDLLLGSDIYALIKMGGISRGDKPSQPLAEQTQLGWILFGKMQSYQCSVVLNNIEDLQRFWEVEDIEPNSAVSSEDQACIDLYLSSTERRTDGRYVVKLPMKPNVCEKLGSSKGKAVAQFLNLEKKFNINSCLADQYKCFISEYIALGHMKQINNLNSNNSERKLSCYLPHHAVKRVESSTTKLRVVFNASAKTASGYSLNDMMYKGPNLQKDLQSLVIKWRLYRYAFTSDIEKMYRMILVNKEDQHYQQIVWRDTPNQQIQTYQLNTVTYGTKAAPYLAMMTLKKLAADERNKYPEAAQVIEEAMYMDDVVHSIDNLENGKRLIADVNNLLESGGFTLRKWLSNEPKLLEDLENECCNKKQIFNFKAEGTSKTLGLRWNSEKDQFTFQYNFQSTARSITKRMILSEISKLFDPLGWLGPLSTKLKLIFQRVWSANLQWDDVVPNDIALEWKKIQSDISNLNQCEIPRWIGYKSGDVIELHGFCDASLKAYAGVIYARIVRPSQVTVVLVASKSRLVPQNKEISLPRLEICGAQLLAKLMHKVVQCIGTQTAQLYGWTDSMVVLGWLQGDPGRWNIFVSNRVKQITEIIRPNLWRYVRSSENPADAASRGLLASQLANLSLWWHGPEWLKTFKTDNEKKITYTTEEECKERRVNIIQQNNEDSIILKLLYKHNSIVKITRILAWILRALETMNKSECKQRHSYLTLRELKRAKLLIIKYVQRCEFADDIEHFRKHRNVHSRSKLLNLNPFLDSNGILRVGGRLKNAQIHDDMKYPIIIPHRGILTKLLIDQAHLLTYHGGPRLTLSNLRQRYWIISGSRAVKKEVNKCVKCRKHDPRLQYQLMGDLPDVRVNPAPPFYYTGVDYTGFVEVKANKGRGIKTTKGYVALFICMVTKAVHLELVSDLSSAAFLAALRRMAARRGAPRHIFSDNGTNFVGANRILQEEFHDLKGTLDDTFFKEIAELSIEWHFNAPSWPSAGGLWERAIRSLKHHLKRVVGEQRLTYEEFSTLLAQLEACMNSRPLCALSENVDDLEFLTPAHFLTGRVGNTIIETNEDARTRWNVANKLAQDIWKRFKVEYLTQLSVRSKWLKQQNNLKIGDLVTIHDDNLPPGKWMLGRVLELHPGPDRLVRVVSLKTKNGILKRPIVKLSLLPVESNNINENLTERKKIDAQVTNIINKPRSRGSSSFLTMTLSLILFIMALTSGTYASYNITEINKNQGLFFDKIGNLRLVRDQWKLIVYYNMDPYWDGMKAIQKYQTYLEHMCKCVNTLSPCDVILLQLRHDFEELEFTNRILLGQQNDTRAARAKRGLINGIGYLANSLFGILDERFAEKYQQDITQLQNNQKHLASLWRNQISVIEGEYNVLKRIEETINKQHNIISERLNKLDKAVYTLQEEIKLVEQMNEFISLTMISNNIISNMKSVQDKLVDMLTDIHHQQFNPHILSPQQFRDELNIISGQLTKDLSLPIENIHDIAKIYRLLKVRARLTTHYFIFEISIPLITRVDYEFHKIIPIPLRRNNNSITVILISDYLAINLKKDFYMPIKETEMQQCVDDGSSNYLCSLHSTIYHLKTDSNLCLYDPSTAKCQTRTVACNNKWTQLNNRNSYLFFCCEQCALRFICKDQVTVEQIKGTYIMNLAPDCIVKDKHFTTYAHNHFSRTINIDADIYNPQIAPINHIINISLPMTGNETTGAEINSELLKLGESIKRMKAANLLEDESDFYHHVHHYAIGYGLMIVAVVCAAAFLWRRKRLLRRREGEAPPSPSISAVSARKQKQARRQPNVKCISANVINEDNVTGNKTNSSTSPIPRRVLNIPDSV